jgi:effector-binding domain-containing protein
MIKIGDFSRLSRVTVKSLRYYDEIGLLKPVNVDQFTGYRYYEVDQLARLNRIIALKDMGLSLEEIARLLNENVSVAHILDLLRVKQEGIRQKLADETARLRRVEEWLRQTEKEGKMPDYEVILKQVPPQKVLALRKTLPGYSSFGQLFGEIMPYLFQSGGQMVGPPTGVFHDEEFKESNVDMELALPIAADLRPRGDIKVRELPAELMATVIHKGSYETVSAAYTAVMKWIDANGYDVAGPSREVYFTDPNSGTPPSEYVTEVQFPVRKKK